MNNAYFASQSHQSSGNPSQALIRLDDDKDDIIISDTSSNGVIQKRRMSIVNGPGMYWKLEVGNPSQALSRLDEDEKGITTNDTLGGHQKMSIVNESGVYPPCVMF